MQFSRASSRPDLAVGHPQSVEQSDEAFDLTAFFATVWRGKLWIAFVTAIFVLLGGYYAFVAATPKYRSTAVVILETDQLQILDLETVVGGLSGDSTEVNSELEVLRARSLIGKVVDRLELQTDPEFNAELRPPSRVDRAKDAVMGMLGIATDPVILPGEDQEARTRDAVITELLRATSVRNVPLSLVFQITVETENAVKSALIADTLVELYILNQIEVKFEATEQATIWLSERVAELQANLEQAEARVAEFSASTDLISVDGLRALERQIKDLRDRIDGATIERASIATRLADLQAASSRAQQAALSDDDQLEDLLGRVENDERFEEAFDNRLARVTARLTADLARADQQLDALRASETDLASDLDQQANDLIDLQQLTREAEASRVLYEYFLTRFNETSAQLGIQQADSRILSNAVVPTQASEPRKLLVIAMSAMVGAMLGASIVLFREARKTGFRTARELERISGQTVLGQIPKMPVRSRRKVIQYLTEKPMSAAAEAYRNLRTSLMLSHHDNPPKVIIMTSSVPAEGKTTNSIALAQNFLGLGKKVLLVEGDIRRRTLNQYFDNVPKDGLLSVMNQEKPLADAVFQSTGFGADILAGEQTTKNAADVFSSQAFEGFVMQARETYDIVIIDTPPILVVPDARIIAEQADAVIFTVLWDRTSRAQVEESLRLFQTSGQQVTGLALSQISPKGMKRYGYGGNYGAYAGYGSKYYVS